MTEEDDTGTTQVDLVLSLLAVMLVLILAVIPVVKLSLGAQRVPEYRPSDPERQPFMLVSLDPLARYQNLWVVWHGTLGRIATGAIAAAVLTTNPSEEYRIQKEQAIVTVRRLPAALDSFEFEVDFIDQVLPEWLVEFRTSLRQADEITSAAETVKNAPGLLFVRSAEVASVAPLLSKLRLAHVPHRVILLEEGDEVIRIYRTPGSFGLLAIMRPF
jgi:hypothetical protein